MKRVLERIIALTLAGSLVACAQPDSDLEPGTFKVVAPMSDGNSNYKLKSTILTGVEDVKTMSGQYARFFMSPKIENNKLVGESPKARFIRNNEGEYIPGNSLTQQMVAIYAHLERLAHLDIELGAIGVNTWPRDVGIGVRIVGGNENNAFYDGKSDSMLFVPYNQADMPIPINGGIIAHEHFHSLFYKLVLKDTEYRINAHDISKFLTVSEAGDVLIEREKSSAGRKIEPVVSRPFDRPHSESEFSLHRYYHVVIARALNEGLADFWGWMYTGDPDFIAQSLPSQQSSRSLKADDILSVSSLPTESALKSFLNLYYATSDKKEMNSYAVGFAYSVASQYSRVLKRFTDVYAKERGVNSLDARKEIAKVLVRVMPLINKDLKNLGKKYYSSAAFIKSFVSEIGILKQSECEYLSVVMTNSSDDKQYSCNQSGDDWTLTEKESSSSDIAASEASTFKEKTK